ncbi:phage tail assembly chaperone [Rhodocyclaceae bacterium SMB388]
MNKIIPATAAINVPGQDAPALLTIFCKRMPAAEVLDWMASVHNRNEADWLLDVVVGWGDEIDTPFNREALSTLLDNHHGAVLAFFAAYLVALTIQDPNFFGDIRHVDFSRR